MTDPPSLTVVVEAVRVYEGCPRLVMNIVLDVPTTLPPLPEEPVKMLTSNASIPSSYDESLAIVFVKFAYPPARKEWNHIL